MLLAGLLVGCNSTATKSSSTKPSGNGETCVLHSGGLPMLRLTMPERAKCQAQEGALFIKSPKYNAEVWLVAGARTVDEALPRVPGQIIGEFQNFKPHQSSDLTVAGSPAKRQVGSGLEADDGDPGEADVIVFKVGERIFVGCAHGEGLSAADHQGLLTLVQSAQQP
jgi:hypothetical protein